ncbi:MAG: ABC transporter ATP-binding protein/permease [Defluviitaleaceae bacterium]|nr:ABC transporter ATP-binding protein/permease [Defluviitaleaceae bacterium]
MKNLAKYLKPFWLGIAAVVFLLLGQSFAELYLPTRMSAIVNDGIIYAAEHGVSRTSFVLRTGAEMLVFALLAGCFSIAVTYISPKIAAGAARKLRRDLFVKVESFSQAEFDKFSSASLITRCTNDVTQVQNVVNFIPRMLLYAPILAIGGMIMAIGRAPGLNWILGLAVVVLFGLVSVLVAVVMPKFKTIQEKTDRLNKIAREILHGFMVIRAFGTQKYENERFGVANTDLRDLGLFVARTMAFVNPLITFIIGFTQVGIIWFGGHQVAEVGLDIGDMMAFFQYTMQVLFAFMMISMVLVMVPRAQVSAVRINEILQTELSVVDIEATEDFEASPDCPTVVFENVSFRYPNAEAFALEDISFSALAGQTTAIIGSTGAGKSTIAQLLLRFYDVSEGKISVGGRDIRLVRQAALRQKIGYVPQKGILLSGTIESNIRYGTTPEHIREAAEIAQAMEFINEKKNGFLAEISQGGGNVSGGQRQRLSIARALAKKPEILVFDDSFSALDFQTDARLRQALKQHTRNAVVILIAQRVGTIINAEQILVLEEGKIAGRGTHEELLKSCPEYLEIARSQGVTV